MSVTNFQQFRTAVAANEKLQAEVQGKTLAEVISLAAQHGYHFTQEEVTAATNEMELTEEQLERVAGGRFYF